MTCLHFIVPILPKISALYRPLKKFRLLLYTNLSLLSISVSIIAISLIVSTLISGFVSESLGRKKALATAQLIVFIGWIIIYFATNYEILLVAQCVRGLGIGISFPTTAMYLSEISLIRYRGILSTMNTVVMNSCVVVSLMMASALTFENLILVSALPPVIFVLMLILLQESPFWLVKKERVEEAENALLALRGPQYEIKYELEEMKSLLAKQQGNNMTLAENLKQLRSRTIFMPVLVVLAMLVLQVLNLISLCLQFSILYFSASEWM